MILKNLPLDLLSFFIANSIKNISSHSGPVLNMSAAFDVDAVDIIKESVEAIKEAKDTNDKTKIDKIKTKSEKTR